MNAFYTLFLVLALMLIAIFGVGAAHLDGLFGVWIPYAAVVVFIGGFCWRVYKWATIPVPFRIPTTAGQQKSFDWIEHNPIDNPSTTRGTWLRMMGEVFLFRTLFRNTYTKLYYEPGQEPKVAYFSQKWLWLFAILFHYSFLIIAFRHLRFFTDPVPFLVNAMEQLDGIVEMFQPNFYVTDALIVLGVGYLFVRRLMRAQMRYLSLAADFFPLFLILGIALSGIYMRYIDRVDVASIKQLTMGLATFRPVVPEGIALSFYVHLFLVCTLLFYFPFSKLMHMGGIFLSPTRNMANNTRFVHHENPWNPRIPPHSYAAYEDDFREPMAEAGLPLEKPLEQGAGE